jgi:hypothetical protein
LTPNLAPLPPVSLIPAANLPPVSLKPVTNLPPVSTTLAKLVAKFAAGVEKNPQAAQRRRLSWTRQRWLKLASLLV